MLHFLHHFGIHISNLNFRKPLKMFKIAHQHPRSKLLLLKAYTIKNCNQHPLMRHITIWHSTTRLLFSSLISYFAEPYDIYGHTAKPCLLTFFFLYFVSFFLLCLTAAAALNFNCIYTIIFFFFSIPFNRFDVRKK